MPRVTIVIRTRDRKLFLQRALQSVGSQTFRDYEAVIVNDGGDPDIVTTCISHAPLTVQQRIRRIDNPTSHGREAAIEDGIENSQAEFLAIHDDDDTWEPNFLESCVAYLDLHPEQAAVATRADVVYEHVREGRIIEDSRDVIATDRSSWTLVDSLITNYVPTNSQMIRRSAAEAIGKWNGSYRTQADWDFNLRLLASHSVGFLPDQVLAHYHQRPHQEGSAANSVLATADQHQRDNLAIRDAYLRAGGSQVFGIALLNGELFARLQNLTNGHAQHHADLLNRILENQQAITVALDGLSQRVDAINERLGKLEQARYEHTARGAAVRTLQKCPPAYRSVKALRDRLRRPVQK